MKGLDGMIRLSKWRVDELRKEQGALQALIADADRTAARLDAEAVAEGAAAQAPDAALTYGAYIAQVQARKATLAASRAGAVRALEAKAEALAEAFEELKKYEILAERTAARADAAAVRRQQAELDEIGLQRHVRAAR